MDEFGEGPPLTELNPAQKQTQLKSIYASLPETAAIAKEQVGPGHFIFDIPQEEGVTPEEKSTRFLEGVGKFAKDSLEKNDLRRMKLEELKRLLPSADIIPLLRERVGNEFTNGFIMGTTKEGEDSNPNSIFRLIGVTPDSEVPEGIFSLDPTVRQAIDQAYLMMHIGWIETKRRYIEQSIREGKTNRVEIFQQDIDALKQDMERGKAEFRSLYGKDPQLN